MSELSARIGGLFKQAIAPTADRTVDRAGKEVSVKASDPTAKQVLGRDTLVRSAAAADSMAKSVAKVPAAVRAPRLHVTNDVRRKAVGEGRLIVSPQGNTFQWENGVPFVPVGHTEAFSFFNQLMNDKPALAHFLADMHKRGENTLMVQVENEDRHFWRRESVVDGVKRVEEHPSNWQTQMGKFNPDIERQFTEFLDLAEKNHIKVFTYTFDTFHMDFGWPESPWNVANGGPCKYPSDMLTDPQAIALQKQTLAHAIDLWGNHPALGGWDLLNEYDWAIAGPVPASGNLGADGQFHIPAGQEMMEAARKWHDDMIAFVKDYQAKRWPDQQHHPLLMTSSNNPNVGRGGNGEAVPAAKALLDHPGLDVVGFHGYIWPPPPKDGNAVLDFEAHGPTTDPVHPLDAFDAIGDATRYLARTAPDKAILGTEEGELGYFLKQQQGKVQGDYPIRDAYQHAMYWGELVNGAAGPGLRWPYPNVGFDGHPFMNPLTPAMQQSLTGISKITRYVDWNAFKGVSAQSEFVLKDKTMHAAARRDEHQLLGWIAKDSRVEQRASVATQVSFSGFADEAHQVVWFDDRSGKVLKRVETKGSSFVAETPPFADHIAVVVRPMA